MNRRDIERVLETKDQSVLDFPDRGIWGDNRYRGNCSGWIQAFLISCCSCTLHTGRRYEYLTLEVCTLIQQVNYLYPTLDRCHGCSL